MASRPKEDGQEEEEVLLVQSRRIFNSNLLSMYTPNGELAKRWREIEARGAETRGWRFKVVPADEEQDGSRPGQGVVGVPYLALYHGQSGYSGKTRGRDHEQDKRAER